MRIEFKREGGIAHFPGLSKPATIDTEQLSHEERAELESLVEEVGFFELPVSSPPPRGAADYYQYTVTVEAGGRRHTVRFTDLMEDPKLQRLLTILRTKAKEQATRKTD